MIRILRKIFAAFSQLFSISHIRFAYRMLQAELERRGNNYITTHCRPKATHAVSGNWMSPISRINSLAIVVQGPIITTDDFTLNSVLLYAKLYPRSRIIVSTWNNTPSKLIEALKISGIHVVLSDMPSVSGVLNVNYQIVSTRSGIVAAIEGGADYVIKIRSDQRIYSSGLETALPALLNSFPQRSNKIGGRIIVSSNDTRLFIPYHLSDQFQFGRASDMLFFWSAPLDARPREIDYTLSIRQMVVEKCIAEVYLTTSYIERAGLSAPCALNSWWNYLADIFCIVDGNSIDCFWPKYEHFFEYRGRNYGKPTTGELVTFLVWLQLLSGSHPKVIEQNSILDYGISDLIPNMVD